MKVLELFCGTKSISNAFKERGHEVYTVDWEKSFEPTLCADIGNLTAEQVKELCGGIPEVIWASPDCTSYSVAAIGHHRKLEPNGNLKAVTDYAKECDKINTHLIALINELNPTYWFIENPRGALRKMDFMKGLPLYTVTYCQYGDTRQKPTDIWTNHPNPKFKPPCKAGAPCHVAAPRGSKTGTQGIKGSKDRARIPKALCEHIVDICESVVKAGMTIAIDGKEYEVFLCDRQAACKNSRYCGKECRLTIDKKHAVLYEQINLFDEVKV